MDLLPESEVLVMGTDNETTVVHSEGSTVKTSKKDMMITVKTS